MAKKGYEDRKKRLKNRAPGTTATHSQDYLRLTSQLYEMSAGESRLSPSRNCSYAVFAGIPMLLAALQAFVVEYEVIYRSTRSPNSCDVTNAGFPARYGVSGDLLTDFQDLIELRNEIIHPAHAPCGTSDNWPTLYRRLKDLGLLDSTGDPSGDYSMLAQMASHRLFGWAVKVIRRLYELVIHSDPQQKVHFDRFLLTFDPPWFTESPLDEH